MNPKVKTLIEHFHLTPLPAEGTLFISTWRSTQEFADGSPIGTAMLGMYCLDPLSQSLFHRLPIEETWHFYSGDPFRLILLSTDGSSQDVIMGSDPLKGQQVQFVVPAGTWQAGHLVDGGAFALFGCTLAPGFTGSMYEGGHRGTLCAIYPDRVDDIFHFTQENGNLSMPEGFAK